MCQMSSMIGCKESNVVHYNEICEVSPLELCPNAVDGGSQPIKWENLSILSIAFPLLM